MMITHAIKMDFCKREICPRIDAVQGDSYTRVVEISLYENGVAWAVPNGASALLRFFKPDGTGGLYDTLPDGSAAWSTEENVVRFTLAPQLLAVPGLVQVQLEIVKGSTTVGSFTFQIVVERDPSNGAAASEDYFSWNAWAEMALSQKLQEAKESGEFNGPQGPTGYTPVRGTDYYTEADHTEMVERILAALPVAEGVGF